MLCQAILWYRSSKDPGTQLKLEALTNLTIALNPSSVSLLTGTGSSPLSVSLLTSTPVSIYTIVIDGTSENISHNATSILRVVPPPPTDFSTAASPSPMNVTQGSASSSTLTWTSIGGFAGTVVLTTSISPGNAASPTLTLNPNRVTLLPDSTGNAVLTVNTTGGTSRGTYAVVVLGVSGTLANTVSITLMVQ